mmetsp:Transcript_50006/g.113770  ORF Transcript_50006/g.113770 Transcript_50006/m.113770 type:complete len:223 (-) Transcript_50006:299-967(-)
MLTDLGRAQAPPRIRSKHPRDDVDAPRAEEVRERVLRREDLAVKRRRVLILERKVAAEHGEEDYSATPDVALFVIASPQDLRSDVVRRSSFGLHWIRFAFFESVSQAKVDDLDLCFRRLITQQEVLGLDVPVHAIGGVHVHHGAEDLLHIHGCASLVEGGAVIVLLGLLNDPVEELTPSAKFHDKVVFLRVFEDLIKFHDVRMVQGFVYVDLLLEALLVRLG